MSLAARDLPAAIGRRPELLPQLSQAHQNTEAMIARHSRFRDFQAAEVDRAMLQLGLLEQLYNAGEIMARMTPPASR